MNHQDPGPVRQDVGATTVGAVVQVGSVTGDVHVHEPSRAFGSVVPRQLPAPPALFTGRDADLARLARILGQERAGTVVISAVSGAGGIGKSWLALHWAHRHVNRFPDGQLHVDLRGFSPDSKPMATSVALHGFLCALGVQPAAIPVDEHAQAALFRSVTSGKKMLIVLDNAAGTEQITPLLPGSSSCTVLVTSRRRLAGLSSAHGAHYLDLDVLPASEAHALLARRIGATRLAREPEAADELVAGCGGFPLALSVVAGRAAAQPRLPLSTLVAELREAGLDGLDDGDAAASVPLVLSWSYRALTPQQAQVFTLLGSAPGPDISLAATCSLAGTPARQLRTVLQELERASLLIQHTPGRYRMHDLIRACARDHADCDLTSVDRHAALSRVIDFYVHTAHRAHRLLEPHDHCIALRPPVPGCRPHQLTSHAEALEWFTAEYPCLLSAQLTARQHGPWPAVWQLAWALTAYHSLRGLLGEDLHVWLEAECAADLWPDPVVDTLVHRYLGNACVRTGRFEEGRDRLLRALIAAERTDDLGSQARILRIASVMYEHQGNNQSALTHATRALELFRAVGDPVWEADTLNTVGWCAALLGRYDEARQHCRTAFAALRVHHPPGAADALDTLGYIAHHTGQHTDALDYFRRALALYRDLGDIYHVPDTLDRAGRVLVTLDRNPEARAAWTEALTLYRAQHRIADARRVQQQIDTPDLEFIAQSWPCRRR
ncbi:tetratricopeptide repeat protein [Amycolatopsis sp. CA-128772]|uniref:ATP-binding protein n=1 Tax=Amycolatopsis sp. CA-128772 TaxID=2073159 RepID=UPI001304AD16|nr:tetratricopeptide repeat protein [Amycolatopsis sp. CA-128772]